MLESKHFLQEFVLLYWASDQTFGLKIMGRSKISLSSRIYIFSQGMSDNLLTQCIMERVGGRSQARLLASIKEVLMPLTLIGLRQYPPA